MPALKKIVILGPESTGKSTLCRELAAHYKSDWVPEYAREYLLSHGMSYTYEDLLIIARGQIALEDEHVKKVSGQWSVVSEDKAENTSRLTAHDSLLFIDTNIYVMKVWCEFVFGKCHPWILEQIQTRKYDGYLLCRTDLPWVKDELREYPDLGTREKLFHIYKDCMIHQSTPWAEVSGTAERRLLSAVEAMDSRIF